MAEWVRKGPCGRVRGGGSGGGCVGDNRAGNATAGVRTPAPNCFCTNVASETCATSLGRGGVQAVREALQPETSNPLQDQIT